MSDEDLEHEELDGAEEEDEGEELAAADDGDANDDGDGDDEIAPVSKSKKTKAAVDVDDLPSVEANVVADPPKKPDSKYGSRPI